MDRKCPRCRTLNMPVARFCSQCGLSLTAGVGGAVVPGRIRHPKPVPPPDGFEPCKEADHLHYRWGPAWGKSFLLGTEGIAVFLFNGAYPLQEVVLKVCGIDDTGTERFSLQPTIEAVPVGQEVKVEIPSYELSDDFSEPVRKLEATLVSAEFGSDA